MSDGEATELRHGGLAMGKRLPQYDRDIIRDGQTTPGAGPLTDCELALLDECDALERERDEARARFEWSEQARGEALIGYQDALARAEKAERELMIAQAKAGAQEGAKEIAEGMTVAVQLALAKAKEQRDEARAIAETLHAAIVDHDIDLLPVPALPWEGE